LQVLALLRRQAQQAAALMITHDIAATGAACDRIAVMLEGEIVEESPRRRCGRRLASNNTSHDTAAGLD